MNDLEKATLQAPEGIVRSVLLNNFAASGIEVNIIQSNISNLLTWIKHPKTMLETVDGQPDILANFVTEVIAGMEKDSIPLASQILYSGWLKKYIP